VDDGRVGYGFDEFLNCFDILTTTGSEAEMMQASSVLVETPTLTQEPPKRVRVDSDLHRKSPKEDEARLKRARD
jgi:hypothetical protein